MALFLASDAAKNVTGQVIDVTRPTIHVVRLADGPNAVPADDDGWTVEELAQRWGTISSATM